MKAITALIAASLATNLAVIALLVAGARSAPPALPATTIRTVDSAKSNSVPAGAWHELQHPDFTVQMERLRAEGFPPAMIRAIIASQIRERFAARRKMLEGVRADTPFWWPPQTSDAQQQSELRALAREERTALNELLGPDSNHPLALGLRRILPTLSEEKVAQLTEVQERYDDKRSELYANMRGVSLPGEVEQIDALDRSMRAEFEAVLSPEEFEDYTLRASRTAMQMRITLAAFDSTEDEFRAMFKLQKAFDDQFGLLRGGMSPEAMRTRNDAQRKLAEQIKTTLGETRYAEYQRATDFNYRRTSQLVARLDLPPQTSAEIHAIQQEIQQKVTEVGRTPANPTERSAQRAALAAEAEAKLTAKLGPAGYEAYKEYGGSWLQRLIPPAPKQ